MAAVGRSASHRADRRPGRLGEKLRARLDRQSRELGLPAGRAHEAFSVTAWGTVPTAEQLRRDFPGLVADPERDERLEARLVRWGAA